MKGYKLVPQPALTLEDIEKAGAREGNTIIVGDDNILTTLTRDFFPKAGLKNFSDFEKWITSADTSTEVYKATKRILCAYGFAILIDENGESLYVARRVDKKQEIKSDRIPYTAIQLMKAAYLNTQMQHAATAEEYDSLKRTVDWCIKSLREDALKCLTTKEAYKNQIEHLIKGYVSIAIGDANIEQGCVMLPKSWKKATRGMTHIAVKRDPSTKRLIVLRIIGYYDGDMPLINPKDIALIGGDFDGDQISFFLEMLDAEDIETARVKEFVPDRNFTGRRGTRANIEAAAKKNKSVFYTSSEKEKEDNLKAANQGTQLVQTNTPLAGSLQIWLENAVESVTAEELANAGLTENKLRQAIQLFGGEAQQKALDAKHLDLKKVDEFRFNPVVKLQQAIATGFTSGGLKASEASIYGEVVRTYNWMFDANLPEVAEKTKKVSILSRK